MAVDFTLDDVRRLGALAKLELTDDEVALFADQLSGILAFAAEVEGVDTSARQAQPLNQSAPAPLRDDVLRPSLTLDEVLGGAPEADRETGLITVPRVFNA